MEPLVTKYIKTDSGIKDISVFHADICDLSQNIDMLVLSAVRDTYAPVGGSVIGAINERFNVSVELLSLQPFIDLRKCSGVWISKQFISTASFNRIACVEIKHDRNETLDSQMELTIFSSIKTLFSALTIASINNIPVETVAIPALGTNAQNISLDVVMPPLLNECLCFLKQCDGVKHILFYENSPSKAFKIAKILDESYKFFDYQIHRGACETLKSSTERIETKTESPIIFISYSSKDYDVMLKVNELLENKGLRTWFAPRDIILSSYATSIVKGIKSADYFLVILSVSSMKSRHVMNELDLSFSELACENRLIPVKIDQTEMNDAFRYYLSRFEWYQFMIHPNNTNLTALEDVILHLREDTMYE